MPGTDLRERLWRAGAELEVEEPPVRSIVRRGRRRIALRVVAGVTCVVVVGATIAWSIASLIALAPGNGGRPRPVASPSIAPVHLTTIALPESPTGLTTLNGYVYAIGVRGAVMIVDPKKGRPRTIARIPFAHYIESGSGYLWAWPSRGGGLARVNPRSRVVLTSLGPGAHPPSAEVQRLRVPGAIEGVTGGFGSLWVLNDRDQLFRIDPTTGTLLAGPIALPHSSMQTDRPVGIEAAFGYVWVAHGVNVPVVRLRPTNMRPVAVPGLGPSSAGWDLLAADLASHVMWACCDSQGAIVPVEAATGKGLAPAFPGDLCTGYWSAMVPVANETGGSIWLQSAGGCGGTGASRGSTLLRFVPTGTPGHNAFTRRGRLEGPVFAGDTQSTAVYGRTRIWVNQTTTNGVVSLPADVPLPELTRHETPLSPWWARWGWVLAGLTALILAGGVLARFRRRSELTAR